MEDENLHQVKQTVKGRENKKRGREAEAKEISQQERVLEKERQREEKTRRGKEN